MAETSRLEVKRDQQTRLCVCQRSVLSRCGESSSGYIHGMGLKSFSVFVGLLLLCAVSQGADTNAMRTIAKAAFSGIQEPCQVVITNAADWEKLWSRHNVKTEPKEPVPNVDFEKESVLVVAQGQKRSGG